LQRSTETSHPVLEFPASRPSFPEAVLLELQGARKHPCDVCLLFLDSIHDNGKKAGLYKENLLLRGCTIRNTEAVVGIVIYAGHETKALLNNSGPRYKRSQLERQMNCDVLWCVLLLVCMSLFSAVGKSPSWVTNKRALPDSLQVSPVGCRRLILTQHSKVKTRICHPLRLKGCLHPHRPCERCLDEC